MDISAQLTADNIKAADAHIFTDGENHILHLCFHRIIGVVKFAGVQLCNACGLVAQDGAQNAGNKCAESLVFSDKVGLTVDLNDGSGIALHQNINNALSCNAVCLLGSHGKSALTQDLDSLVHIAVGFHQRFFAFHHAAAGFRAQSGNIFCSNICHNSILRIKELKIQKMRIIRQLRHQPVPQPRIFPPRLRLAVRPACLR